MLRNLYEAALTRSLQPLVARSGIRLTDARDLSAGQFLVLFVQLGLLFVVARRYRIEEAYGLLDLLPLILVGFTIHAWLPHALRPPFFVFLSTVAIAVVIGWQLALVLIGLGLILVGIAHLPTPYWIRITLLLAVGAVLATARAGALQWESTTLVLPVLGSMFMFRLVIYVYELRHEKERTSPWQRLSYFFQLPNVCFLLFPVVDYRTFLRTYYDRDANEIYQKGITWMFRGVTHLLLYRIVYYHFVPTSSEIEGLGGVILALVTTYLLYLRISGQFHLIIGILSLFGYNLPETHHLYFLASSFTDYWRRINIYWKDFMMKIFFYPSFMRLRRFGLLTGLVLSTSLVFLATWLLHSYQWFWLQGSFPLDLTDGLFWGLLGVLVVFNVLYEARRGKQAERVGTGGNLGVVLRNTSKVVAMFVVVCILWSLWSSPSVADFISLLSQVKTSSPSEFLFFGAGLIALVLIAVIVQVVVRELKPRIADFGSMLPSAASTGLATILLLSLSLPTLNVRLGLKAASVIESVKVERLSAKDDEIRERGYYEGLLGGTAYLSGLWNAQQKRPPGWSGIVESGVARRTDEILNVKLFPFLTTVFKHAPLETNSHAMRDKEYSIVKPERTYRVALLGASYEMGWGVENHEIFEAVVEERFNEEHHTSLADRLEILNFSVGGYTVIQHVALLQQKVMQFNPDAVILTVHPVEGRRAVNNLIELANNEVVLYDALQKILDKAGIRPGMAHSDARRRLEPFGDEILTWGFTMIANICRETGVMPIVAYVPRTDGLAPSEVEQPQLLEAALGAGFERAWTMDGSFDNHDSEQLRIAPWDTHPNALGHALLAQRLYDQLVHEALDLGLLSSENEPIVPDQR